MICSATKNMIANMYPCPVTMTKYFVSGLLEGMTVEDSMGHVSWDSACQWAAKATENPSCDYVILEMTNVKTGEKEKF